MPNLIVDRPLGAIGYAMPIGSGRFVSPAGSAFMPQSLLDFLCGRR